MDAHPDQSRGAARGICGAMMFSGDSALKKISVLSGGEKSRVLLGKLLVSPSNMLLLDEPTNHLDMESTESLLDAADAFGGAIVFVTHSEMILHALATRLIVFDNGKATLFEGTYQDFLDRVGWHDEIGQQTTRSGPSSNRSASKKALRRQRAELVNEKSRTLGVLQKKIDDLENEIISLERKTEQDNRDLLEASVRGDGETIKRVSQSIHASKSKIESLFSELETLHARFEDRSRAFEEKLAAGE